MPSPFSACGTQPQVAKKDFPITPPQYCCILLLIRAYTLLLWHLNKFKYTFVAISIQQCSTQSFQKVQLFLTGMLYSTTDIWKGIKKNLQHF